MVNVASVFIGAVMGAYLCLSVLLVAVPNGMPLLRTAVCAECAGVLGIGGYMAITLAVVAYALEVIRRGTLVPPVVDSDSDDDSDAQEGGKADDGADEANGDGDAPDEANGDGDAPNEATGDGDAPDEATGDEAAKDEAED